ncbi:MAG: hypothetical protein NVSMB65_04350 [Chloroflexota bacterium]
MTRYYAGEKTQLHRPVPGQRGRRLLAALFLCAGSLVVIGPRQHAMAAAPILVLGRLQNGPNTTEPVSGSGFTPNAQVDIIITNTVLPAGQLLSTLPTDANGNFAGSVTLPLALDAGPAYPNTLIARDHANSSLQSAQQLIGVAVGPVLDTVSPGTTTPGGVLGVIEGTGFGVGGPSDRNQPDVVTLYLGDAPIATARTGPSGNFALGNVRVPANAPTGEVQVIARGLVTGAGQSDVAVKTVVVAGPTTILASPNPAQPGASLSLTGFGFAPNESLRVTATYPDPTAVGGTTTRAFDATAGAAGELGALSLTIPATTPRTGQISILVRGATSDRAAGTVVSLLGARSLFLDPATGPPGSTLTVSGFGFVPGQQVTLLGAGTAGSGTVDDQGTFTTSLTIPPTLRLGTYMITAQDQNGTATRARFVVSAAPTATVAVSPTAASPGASVVVTGTGFGAGEPIALSLENTSLTTQPPQVTADATGRFTTTAVVPVVLSSRSYVLTARGVGSLAVGQTTLKVRLPIISRWYFAEGFTGQGPATAFSETLHLLNPTLATAVGTILYMLPHGITVTVPLTVPAQSIVVRSVNRDVGSGKEVAALVSMDQAVAVNRVILRTDVHGASLDGNSSSGQARPARLWHFAEGYTGVTFQQYLTVQNPSTASAAVTIVLLPPVGTRPATVTTTLPPLSRYTLNVRAALPNRSLSTIVRSSVPVVAERVLYWGSGSGSGKFGSDAKPGVPAGATTSYFAATSVAGGDQPFYTILNPAGLSAGKGITTTATATFVNAAGQTIGSSSIAIGPGQRGTLTGTVPLSTTGPIAAILSATSAVVAEEAQYIGGSPNVGSHAGFALLGRTPATQWQFALGGAVFPTSTTTLTGTPTASVTETVYLYNPGSRFTNVVGAFYTNEGIPHYVLLDLRPHTVLAVDSSTVKGLPAGLHGSVFSSPQDVPFVAALVLRSRDGRVVLGDEGTAR